MVGLYVFLLIKADLTVFCPAFALNNQQLNTEQLVAINALGTGRKTQQDAPFTYDAAAHAYPDIFIALGSFGRSLWRDCCLPTFL